MASCPTDKTCHRRKPGHSFPVVIRICVCLAIGILAAPAQAQQTVTRSLPVLSPEQEAMVRPLLALGQPRRGGAISGYVGAALPGDVPRWETALADVQVHVQPPDGGPGNGSVAATDSSGHFLLGPLMPGLYKLCASLRGFADGCSQIQIADDGIPLSKRLALTPIGRTLRGCVTLKNGEPAARIGRVPGTSRAVAELVVEDASGHPVTRPSPVNSAGCYVIPDIPPGEGMILTARYEQATASEAMVRWPGKMDGSEATNLLLPTAPPTIAAIAATLDGKAISRARPGATVTVTVGARSGANYSLHYAWSDSTGAVIQGDGPTVLWQLPRTNSSNMIYVEVTDGHGGAARAALPVATASADFMKRLPARLGGGAGSGAAPPVPSPSNSAPAKDPPGDPSPSFEFINPAIFMQCDPPYPTSCLQESVSYYRAIGVYDSLYQPQGPYATLAAWKQAWGFSDDPTRPGPNEVRAVYYNNADLQFGRDMHCLEKPFYVTEGRFFLPYQAQLCYVTNFSNFSGLPLPGNDPQIAIELAMFDLWPVATVAMMAVEPVWLSPYFPARPSVAFIVFAPQQQNVGSAGPGASDQFVPVPAAVLDSPDSNPNNGKPKSVPGVCIACHGGTYDRTRHTVDDARFLPFDTPGFIYDGSGQTFFTEAGQGEAFRRMNAMARDADVSSGTAITSTAITDMIDGWYQWCGGVTAPGCRIDDANHLFVPGANPGYPPISCSTPFQPVTCGWADGWLKTYLDNIFLFGAYFYQQVPRTVCRTCHLANANQFNWQNFAGAIGSGAAVCGALANNMPFAQVPFNNFWGKASMRYLVNEAFNCMLPTQ